MMETRQISDRSKDSSFEPKPLVITLVHGTWGSKSKWLEEESTIRKHLETSLKRRVEFVTPRWNGRNVSSARQEAASIVRNQLKENFERYKDAEQYIIAHSHGGNVTLYALEDRDIEQKIAGVICLNTPFISVVRRNTKVILAQLVVLIGVFPLIFLMQNIFTAFEETAFRGAAFLGIGLSIFIGIVILATILTGNVLAPFASWIYQKRERVIGQLLPSPIERCPIFCLSTAGDEPVAVLGFSEAIANLPYLLMHIIVWPFAFVLAFAAQSLGYIPPLSLVAQPPSEAMFSSMFIYAPGFLIALQVLAVAISFAFRGLPLGEGIGWRRLFYNLFVRISVSVVPINCRNVHFEAYDGKSSGVLMHSQIYKDEKAIEIMADWINKQKLEDTF
jgi:hypothetical protein